MSEIKDPGYYVAKLAMHQDEVFRQKTEKCQSQIEQLSDDLHCILDLLAAIRREKENQSGDHIDLEKLRDKLEAFSDLWDRCAEQYEQIDHNDNPFPKEQDFQDVSRSDLEWAETTLRNLESRHQSQIQRHMGQYETDTMEQKQIVEILVQMAKNIRDSSGYYIRQAGKN